MFTHKTNIYQQRTQRLQRSHYLESHSFSATVVLLLYKQSKLIPKRSRYYSVYDFKLHHTI
ncbi:hypothetical protein H6F98_04390 [Microcoleus sp. FACHB-SPT15]|uniref:hypothetical protein n=1 Tax=Microcoleus sp. FACHB-SPT15 TaxID=2692830 RepID=UPI00178020C5|nr:hypothetical protein [Microcoleus sp. FACHB-SPT15]MBD1804712.1 hypothetical protein [Microcoleus sp. FACHB-SPT15]